VLACGPKTWSKRIGLSESVFAYIGQRVSLVCDQPIDWPERRSAVVRGRTRTTTDIGACEAASGADFGRAEPVLWLRPNCAFGRGEPVLWLRSGVAFGRAERVLWLRSGIMAAKKKFFLGNA